MTQDPGFHVHATPFPSPFQCVTCGGINAPNPKRQCYEYIGKPKRARERQLLSSSNITFIKNIFPFLLFYSHSLAVDPIRQLDDYSKRNLIIRNPIGAVNTPRLVRETLSAPPTKTVSNGLPPPEEPRPGDLSSSSSSSSSVCVGLGVFVDDVVVVFSVSVAVALAIVVSMVVGVSVVVVALSVLLAVGIVSVVVELSLLSSDVELVFVDELSDALVIVVEVFCVWLGVKKVRVVLGCAVEVTMVTWKLGQSASTSPPCNASPRRDLSLTSRCLQASITRF